jgi:hypothetical protein
LVNDCDEPVGSAKGKFMKKTEEMRAEYRREDLGKGVRGKHYAAFQKGSNLVLLTPALAKIFPTNEAVNSALESLVGVARSAVTKTRRTSGTTAKRIANAR